jgi:hypothetical protein
VILLAGVCQLVGVWDFSFVINFNFPTTIEPYKTRPLGTRVTLWQRVRLCPEAKPIKLKVAFLNGRWGYATGILHCDYMVLPALLFGSNVGNGAEEVYRIYIPVEDCEIHDTWHVSVMKASGSQDVSLYIFLSRNTEDYP